MSLFKITWQDDEPGHVSVHNAIGAALNNAHYSVKWFGAVGDGETDDTTAIANAITAIPSAGGILFFPPGVYKTSGGFTISNPTTILGCGMIGENGVDAPTTKITCTSATAVLFTVSAYTARFRDVALVNTSATPPTDGAGIKCYKSGFWDQKVDFRDISVTGFYINIDVETGEYWTMDNCMLYFPVKYALKIANVEEVDSGDWSITNSYFIADVYAADAAIRIESSGGGKIANIKVNNRTDEMFVHGIDLAPQSGATIILHVMNSSIENVTGNGINVANYNNSVWRSIVIQGNEFGLWSNSTGHCIQIAADVLARLRDVVIAGNTFFSLTNNTSAIDLSKVQNAQIYGNVQDGFASMITQANCSGVVVDFTA